MWKYECKKHLLYIVLAMIAGALLFGVFGFGKQSIVLALDMMEENTGMVMEELYRLVENPFYLAAFGTFYIGGFVNGLMLMFALNRRFNFNYFLILAIFLLGGDFILLAGALLLIPTIIICLYGMLTVPNRKDRDNLKKAKVSSIAELKRQYELHYKIDEQGVQMGKEAASNMFKIAILNVLAVGIYIMLMLYVMEFTILLVAAGILMMLLYIVNQMRMKAVAPIVSLLYDQCDPIKCASAIFAMSEKLHRKKTLTLTIQFAESMLLLNDPHLCIEALTTIKPHKGHVFMTYHSIMAEAYYLLGDELMVKTHYEQVEQGNNQANVSEMLTSQVLKGIQNRIDLMNQNFDEVKLYYQKLYSVLSRKSHLVELNYYLGLIAFVEKEFTTAMKHLEFVVKYGGTTYFVEKAENLLLTLEQVQ